MKKKFRCNKRIRGDAWSKGTQHSAKQAAQQEGKYFIVLSSEAVSSGHLALGYTLTASFWPTQLVQ